MSNDKHKIVIGSTQKLFSDGLESMISELEDFIIIECIHVEKLMEYLTIKNSFDILIVEFNYPNQTSLRLLKQIKHEYPEIHIMIISQQPEGDLGYKLVDSKIDAYLLKDCTKHDVFLALRKISEDKSYFCSDIIKDVLNNTPQKSPGIDLTRRESEILALLVNCKTNMQIANELGLSENTVKTHRKNLFTKFGVNNIIGMIRYACRARLIDYGPDGICSGCPHFR